MIELIPVEKIENKKHIAILDTSSISFMQELDGKGIAADIVLQDYELLLIPNWVLTEINDAAGRKDYVYKLRDKGYPIYRIAEESYSELVNQEEGNLYQIVLASTYQIGRIKSYLRRFVEKSDILDMDAYQDWINKLYEEWPIPGQVLSSGRMKKKNAGEVSITVLSEIVSWYYPETETLTVYSQDSDAYEFQQKAEAELRKIFSSRTPVPVSFKSNDAVLCQLYREGKIKISDMKNYRNDIRKITYSRERQDHSVMLVMDIIDNDLFIELIQDENVHIIF